MEDWTVMKQIGAVLTLYLSLASFAHGQTAVPPQPTPPALIPVPFDQAVEAAATALFEKAGATIGGADKIEFAIDPLIDGITGAQSIASHQIEARILNIATAKFAKFEVRPFMDVFLARTPLVLVGTFTAINNAGQVSGKRDSYRVCLTFADLRTQVVVAKGVARATFQGIDPTPTAFFSESPVWARDPATDAYVKTCQGTKLQEKIDPTYFHRMLGSALIEEGIKAYDAHNYKSALELYQSALSIDGGDQLRAYNGVYLANLKLHRDRETAEAFGNLIAYSLKTNRLGVRFLFEPGKTTFVRDPPVSGQYPMWLSQLAKHVSASTLCLDVIGHTSPTGSEPANEVLAAARSEAIKARLVAADPKLVGRITSRGVGSRENLVGTGRDDASDAADRRVEFNLRQCT
jgi:outer membrane protein OmpA-like peptidoglycan-associated protein